MPRCLVLLLGVVWSNAKGGEIDARLVQQGGCEWPGPTKRPHIILGCKATSSMGRSALRLFSE